VPAPATGTMAVQNRAELALNPVFNAFAKAAAGEYLL